MEINKEGNLEILSCSDKCYAFSTGISDLLYTFDMMIPFYGEEEIAQGLYEIPDADFQWIIIGEYLIEPIGFDRIRVGSAGTGAGTTSLYGFEFKQLHKFSKDIFKIIEKSFKRLEGKKRKTEQLTTDIYIMVVNRDEKAFIDNYDIDEMS